MPVNRRRFLGGATAMGAFATRWPAASAQRVGGLPARPELVVKNAYVLTMDPALGDLHKSDVHIRDGEIIAVAPNIEVAGLDAIDATGMVVLPGIVDTHWHMWNSLLRGLVGTTRETAYFPTLLRFAPHYTPQDTYVATRLALAEAVNAGVVTVHNWAHNIRNSEHADRSVDAHLESGLRARFSYGSPQGLSPNEVQDMPDVARIMKERFSASASSIVKLGVALRGPQMSTMAITRQEFSAAKSLGLPITVHMTGDAAFSDRFKVIQSLDNDGLLGPDVQVIHAVHATQQDIETLKRTRAHLSVSPYAESGTMGVARVNEFLAAGIPVSLSIDNTALPSSVDPFALMRLLISLQQAKDGLSSPFGPRQALEMATISGARDLGMDSYTGSITPGKRADMIVVDLTALNLTMAGDDHVDRQLMAAQPSNVDTVIADGRVLKRGGKLVGVDPHAIIHDAMRASTELLRRAA